MTFSVPGYRVEQLLGTGSQAQVWAGQSTTTGERVALKRIAVPTAAAARAARAEAALLAALDHPSLIRLREYLAIDAAAVLVLELAEAGSLAALLRRRERLTPAEVVAAVSPVAAALAHAHEADVLHGDVSAANVLFNAAGQPKLADLGVARLLLDAGAGGDVFGTPAYLDPAIAAGGPPGLASDVFSLGAVALHALTGAGPWTAPSTVRAPDADQVLVVAATGRIVELERRLSGLPPDLATVLTRVLEVDPGRRGTAAEFALDLRAAVRPTPVVLAGGRILGAGGRHSVERRGPAPAASGPGVTPAASGLGVTPAADPGRPAFRTSPRPSDGELPAALTHVARPRVREVIAEPPASRISRWPRNGARSGRPAGTSRSGPRPAGESQGGSRPAGQSRGGSRPADDVKADDGKADLSRRIALVGAGVTACGLVGALSLTGILPSLPGLRSTSAVAAPTGSAPPTAGAVTAPSKAPAPTSTVEAKSSAIAGDPLVILQQLDAKRSRAYAERAPELLSQVYASSALRTEDAAQLAKAVPAGCGLNGLRTTYGQVAVLASAADSLTVRVAATLSAGMVTCAGVQRGTTRKAGPTDLTITVHADANGYRIASEVSS